MAQRTGAWPKRLGRVGTALVVLSLSLLNPAAAQATKHDVTIPGFSFVPADITIGIGDQVEWSNTSGVEHTVTWHTAGPAELVLAPGAKQSLTFPTEGVFGYHCARHPSLMTGSVTVGAVTTTPSAASSPSAPPPSPSPSPSARIIPAPSPSPRPAASPAPPAASPTPSPAGPSPSPTPSPSPSPSPGETIPSETTSGGGSSVPVIIGILGLLVALGAGAGLLYLRRKSGLPPMGGPPKRPPL
jgi:plastocyanin